MVMTFRAQQLQELADTQLMQKLDLHLSRQLPDYAALAGPERCATLIEYLDAAESAGLHSEQGLASYALAASFLGSGFERVSPLLRSGLRSPLPEVRRVHGMNAWVKERLGQTDLQAEPELPDAAWTAALRRTEPWGTGNLLKPKRASRGLG